MTRLTHLGVDGAARMVDVTGKDATARTATASGRIFMSAQALSAIRAATLAKGDAIATARIAGIMAAKRTHELIPLCHPLPVGAVTLDFDLGEDHVAVSATVKVSGRTGVEMEALTAVSVALLTLYDMAKALDRTMRIEGIALDAKAGGRSGDWVRG